MKKYLTIPSKAPLRGWTSALRAPAHYGGVKHPMNTVLDRESYDRWLVDKCVHEDGELDIYLVCGVTSKEKQDLDLGDGIKIPDVYAVEPKGDRYKVHFEDVVLLLAFDECAHKDADLEFRDDGVIGKYSASSLLNFVATNTLLGDIVPGELMHFEVRTADDWYHVITRENPEVLEVKNA